MTKIALRARLGDLGIHPSKMLGQNFLLDTNLARAIVADLSPREGDHLVEIGSGMGALTEHLCSSPATQITLIERDYRLIAELKERYESSRVRVIAGDAAKIDLRELYGNGSIKVIGNLPYSASTAIIEHFTKALSPASSLVFMLQLEVAERLLASPGDKDYGALTLLLGRRWKVEKKRLVPPDVFWPRPRVHSAVVKITPRPIAEIQYCDETIFCNLVRLGFSSRRKQLASQLRMPASSWTEFTTNIGKKSTIRAENLSLDDWASLTKFMTSPSSCSSKEFLDVVDENDQVLSSQQREDVHVNKLMHRAIHLWIFNAQGELFLQKRSYWKKYDPGLWCSSVAGHVMTGESYEEAAWRELEEELGIHIPLIPFHYLPASRSTSEEHVLCFLGKAEGPFHLQAEEIETGAFFPIKVIKQWIANAPQEQTPIFKMIARDFLDESKIAALLKNESN